MNDSIFVMPQFMTRSVIQSMLHHALTVADGQPCAGLLGTQQLDHAAIRYVTLFKENENLAQILSSWSEAKIECIGFFHMKGGETPQLLSAVLPEVYVELAVSLDEAGRLDLEAFQCKGHDVDRREISMCLIEDGQLVADE